MNKQRGLRQADLNAYRRIATDAGYDVADVSGWVGVAKACGWDWTGIKQSARNARLFILTKFPDAVLGPSGRTMQKIRKAAKAAHFAKHGNDVDSDAFLFSFEWRKLRMVALKEHGARCQCCGVTAADGVRIHVDHIKPRRLFPELALSLENLQVLCEECNHGKGSWDDTDWRPKTEKQGRQGCC